MYRILMLGELSSKIQKRMNRKDRFEFVTTLKRPEGIFVRSAEVPNDLITKDLLVIGRAGAGLNTIDVETCTQNGTMVFNTPGVNSNAVKELVLTSLLNSVRPIEDAAKAVQELNGEDILKQSEEIRNEYIGDELEGKTVGILGLGTIGKQVARACFDLGMDVIGYARQPRNQEYFEQVFHLKDLLPRVDFVVILLPLTEETTHLFDEEAFSLMRKEGVLLNFGRGEVVDNNALLQALDNEQLSTYISDFPSTELLNHPKIKLLPHMGGTTEKALQNGGIVAMRNMRDFLIYGTVRQSANFPDIFLPFTAPTRVTIFYQDYPKIFSKISQKISTHNIDIDILESERCDSYVYTLIDLNEADMAKVKKLTDEIHSLPGVIRLRILRNPNWAPTIYL
ncbi:hypothetical protein C7H83_04515 [Tetragenococcus halophilus]|uniref:D-3-phosphoglycerate dehydrogenase n=1 Tax=Tetragenococcus halophilus TaxID=51669 RepID=A0A3G5FHF9_TETHA|nr:NAD(P)-dependent oxidoreductase [Tetragenococcus halophilus]AYW49794.1 hypothetical protein C7H83_04515 [Tetragenococcus halophilus]GBD63106.1 hypothetical protein TEHD23766T_0533 [Tetragenococcus halophilus subsp. flandriensis]